MTVGPNSSVFQLFEKAAQIYIQKSEEGELSHQDIIELEQLCERVALGAFEASESGEAVHKQTSLKNLEPINKALLEKVERLKEVNALKKFEKLADGYIQKSDRGELSSEDLIELDKLCNKVVRGVLGEPKNEGSSREPVFSKNLETINKVLFQKIEMIREKNLAEKIENLKNEIRKGEISFSFFKDSLIPFSEKMELFLSECPFNPDGIRELKITNVPDKDGNEILELKMNIKEDQIVGLDGMTLSQVKDPIYRDELLKHRGSDHYVFDFFDAGRQPELERRLQELQNEKRVIEKLGDLLYEYWINFDIEDFNKKITEEQRDILNIAPDKILEESDISEIQEKFEEFLPLFPYKEESIKSEFQKATMTGRFSRDGAIGELKSVNIHSKSLGGKQLMDFWDRFCSYMKPSEIYLEDDAKIEGTTGSYNLRLFRLIGLFNKASWYSDEYKYQLYQKDPDGNIKTMDASQVNLLEDAARFKEMNLGYIRELFGKEGMHPEASMMQYLNALIANPEFGETQSLGPLVAKLGDRVRHGEPLHKDLDQLFEILSVFSKYSGQDTELLDLKKKAQHIVESRFYRKKYD